MSSYFAYGTLLGSKEMRRFCPSAVSLGLAELDNFTLAFAACPGEARGGCTLTRNLGGAVIGVVYKVSQPELESLDEVCGVGQGAYERPTTLVRGAAGERIETTTLVKPEDAIAWQPDEDYLSTIDQGAVEANLPAAYRGTLAAVLSAARWR